MNMNNYCNTNYLHGVSYSNKDFLIAKQFEMKEEVSFKMRYNLLFNKKNLFILNFIKKN
jgi:hypothetical protein